ncbi:hypothetical protein [Clostridium culturomicium]|uniref:hypothetical protein n=1 Tax=Clostridium culturomicium TaxID=1499683 RepID=UPI000A7984BE|nr:hypothetical protein [Clostridium culturomicium]
MDPSWGLGTKVTRSVSNDRDYSWYVDQMTTGRNDTYRNYLIQINEINYSYNKT